MNFPPLNAESPTRLEDVPPIYVFASAMRTKWKGTLQIKTDKVVRQFTFIEGNCTGANSNLKSELPGTILQKAGQLSATQYERYIAESRQPKKDPWELIKHLTGLPDPELSTKKTAYVRHLLASLSFLPKIDGVAVPNPAATGDPLVSGLHCLIYLASKLPPDLILPLFAGYSAESSVAIDPKVDQSLESVLIDPEEKGLLTVARNSRTIAEIFDGSFLKKERILFLLFAFWLSGLLLLETPEEVALKKLVDSLDENKKKMRTDALETVRGLNKATYYEWLNVSTQSGAEEIRKRGTALLERYAAPSVEKLFLPIEQPLLRTLLTKLEEAVTVLTHPAKRAEYDTFVSSGGAGSFLEKSSSVRAETVMRDAERLFASGDMVNGIKLLEQSLSVAPSRAMFAMYVRAVLKYENPVSSERKEHVSNELKKALAATPRDSSLLELLGEWSLAMGAKKEAMDAFQRALAINPTSKVAQNQMKVIDPRLASKSMVLSLFAGLEHLNHYQLLGVSHDGSVEKIREVYRALSKDFHPDRFFSSEEPDLRDKAKEVYKRIVEAYMTLKNPTTRKEYNTELFQRNAKRDASGPQTQNGRKFYDLALAALRQNNLESAKLNLQLSVQAEPENSFLRQKLDEISRQPR